MTQTLIPAQHLKNAAARPSPKLLLVGDSIATPAPGTSFDDSVSLWGLLRREFAVQNPGRVAQIIWNSASAPSGTATITAGNTFVDVLHGAWREPNIHEIEVSPPLLPVVGEPISVSITTSEAIRFSIAASIANDLTFGWRVRLNDFA